jgi:hypothetical protein
LAQWLLLFWYISSFFGVDNKSSAEVVAGGEKMTINKGMATSFQRVKITDPKAHKDFEGSGIYTDV